MRIHVLSDLHIEFGDFQYPEVDADLTILAGDIHVKRNGLKWILEAIPDRPVIYIMGNHEFYGERLPRLTEKLKDQAAGTNVHVLENDCFELDGFRFFGATLWTDMVGSIEAQQTMNDYKRIRHHPSYRKLRPVNTRAEHQNSVTQLGKFLNSGDPAKSIVVTHHAPSLLSLPERRREKAREGHQLRLHITPRRLHQRTCSITLDPRSHPPLSRLQDRNYQNHRESTGVHRQPKSAI